VREFIEECDGGISLFHFIPFQSISWQQQKQTHT
jgi:hypothetical protein